MSKVEVFGAFVCQTAEDRRKKSKKMNPMVIVRRKLHTLSVELTRKEKNGEVSFGKMSAKRDNKQDLTFSLLIFSGITMMQRYPLTAATSARPIPFAMHQIQKREKRTYLCSPMSVRL